MAAFGVKEKTKSVYQSDRLSCRKCGTPVYINRLGALPDEISLRCPRCGDRNFYSARAIATLRRRRRFE